MAHVAEILDVSWIERQIRPCLSRENVISLRPLPNSTTAQALGTKWTAARDAGGQVTPGLRVEERIADLFDLSARSRGVNGAARSLAGEDDATAGGGAELQAV